LEKRGAFRYIPAMRHAVDESMHRKTCHFHGRVQGVGFRYTVQNLAMQYNVGGYVRNLDDGSVELVVEGPEGEISNLLNDVSRKMNGFIRTVDTAEFPATGEFEHFAIRH
jgi:acylphosphatase